MREREKLKQIYIRTDPTDAKIIVRKHHDKYVNKFDTLDKIEKITTSKKRKSKYPISTKEIKLIIRKSLLQVQIIVDFYQIFNEEWIMIYYMIFQKLEEGAVFN